MDEKREPGSDEQGTDPIEERLTPTRSDDEADRKKKPTAPGEATTTGTPPNNR
jgi:hypothetical protein